MKFILTFIFCSGMAGKCLAPMEYPEKYTDLYTCLDAGYKQSIVQFLRQVGRSRNFLSRKSKVSQQPRDSCVLKRG